MKDMSQNSNMFHLKLAMLLSSMVQMKNSLMRYLEHDAKETNPKLSLWTQQVKVQNPFGEDISLNQQVDDLDYLDKLSVYTPDQFLAKEEEEETLDSLTRYSTRDNLNMLIVNDDTSHFNSLLCTLRMKGVNIAEFPNTYDQATILPFLLKNDHSIVLFRNPKKDLLNLIKLIVRRGVIFIKAQNQPITVNLTIWVFIDALQQLEKLKTSAKGVNKKPKTMTELVNTSYGTDFTSIFDVALDLSAYTNVDVLGYDYLAYTDNLMLDKLALNLEGHEPKIEKTKLFEYKELKCSCSRGKSREAELEFNARQRDQEERDSSSSSSSQFKLSIGEHFIQYYYLSQRKQSAQNDANQALLSYQNGKATNDKNWMTLRDLVRVKKLADSLNFLRLFFLKNEDQHINEIKLERNLLSQQHPSLQGNTNLKYHGLEIIDSVLAIFFFELTRLFRSGKIPDSPKQLQFRIFYFFSRLKLCKTFDKPLSNPYLHGKVFEDNSSDVRRPLAKDKFSKNPYLRTSLDDLEVHDDSDDDIDGLLKQMSLETNNINHHSNKEAGAFGKQSFERVVEVCGNCRTLMKENVKFKNLYKGLIDEVVRNIY